MSTTPVTSSTEIDHSEHPPANVSSESVSRQVRRDPYGIDSYPAAVSSERVKRQEWGDLLKKPTKIPKPKNEDHDLERGDLLNSDIPEWLQEFRENLVDERVPEH